jgi:hypothetical protein
LCAETVIRGFTATRILRGQSLHNEFHSSKATVRARMDST